MLDFQNMPKRLWRMNLVSIHPGHWAYWYFLVLNMRNPALCQIQNSPQHAAQFGFLPLDERW
jgi:hypothetical protein